MSSPFIGQIMLVGFGFPPRGWATCDGQLLSIPSNTALFSLLGTTFGGDGRTTFGLPDLRGRQATHVGTGPGISTITWGERGGQENVTLSTNNMPTHNHAGGPMRASGSPAGTNSPAGNSLAMAPAYATDPPASDMAADSTGPTGNTGGGQQFGIRDPFLGIYHVIALTGIFPSRN